MISKTPDKELPWLRLYTEMIHDPLIEFLSFEDQRHYVWLLCLKRKGELDKHYPEPGMLDRLVARRLGLQGEAFESFKIRINNSGLLDENWQPKGWNQRQYISDTSTERVRKHRAKIREKNGEK